MGEIFIDTINERIIPSGPRTLIVPAHPHERIEWGFKDQSVRLFVDRKVRQIFENTMSKVMTMQTARPDYRDREHHLCRLQRRLHTGHRWFGQYRASLENYSSFVWRNEAKTDASDERTLQHGNMCHGFTGLVFVGQWQ